MKKIAFILSVLLVSCSSPKKIVRVNHSNLPTPIGPYSHSVRYDNLIFVSGQIGVDPKTNILKESIEEQTIQIFENLKVILKDNHSDLNHIVKTTIFITNIKQYDVVNKLYGQYFENNYPARTTIQIVALPKNAAIEIEFVAVKSQN
ncbi:Rid family detoxifying hydrolase [Flavobacterium sp.]|uniref:RidA family protein n=1 Tax=Flavobacterium sp. TaxID=239 RepID=UPI002C2D65CD|nr:Rid family detoxifying hydrolase [Flavobacterium sp.]HSD06089.1 Rid family detoxifying hydrolase [Flavobacterium sp.]